MFTSRWTRIVYLMSLVWVVGLCAAGLIGAEPAAGAPAKAPLVIGTISSVCPSCPSATLQQPDESHHALNAWVKWTNAHGGIKGHKIVLIYKNDNGDAGQAVADVTALDQSDHVLAIVGQNDPGTVTSWAPYAQAHQLPVIGGENVNLSSGSNPMFFMDGTSVLSLLYGQIAKIRDINKTKFGSLYCTTVAACSQANPLLKSYAPKAGAQYVFDQGASPSQPNFTANCLAAQAAGVEMLQLNAVPVSQVVHDCYRQGYKPAYGLVTPDPLYLNLPGINGSIGNLPSFPPFVKNDATATFHAALHQYDPTLVPTNQSSQAWTAGLLFGKAAAHIGDVPTRQQILDGLYQIQNETFGGLTPPVSYGPPGSPNPPIRCYYLFEVVRNKYVAPIGLRTRCQPTS